MEFYRVSTPDAKRPASPTEEQLYPFILDSQEAEPVNFAGIPLRMLKPFPAPKDVSIEWQIVTKNLETKRLVLSGDFAHFFETKEEAAINMALLLDEDVVAFVSHTSTVDRITGEKYREPDDMPCPYVRVGPKQWTNICPITGEREETFTVTAYNR